MTHLALSSGRPTHPTNVLAYRTRELYFVTELRLVTLVAEFHSVKKRLFTPGPTPVPETVMLKMAEPIIHHRHPEFMEILRRGAGKSRPPDRSSDSRHA
jgi:hypothetical protein